MKDYKRWTERAKDGSPALISERIFYEIVKSQGQGRKHYFADNGDVLDIVTRYIAELEDKIENGTLVELPCKVGTTIYHLYKASNVITEDKVFNYHFEICSKPCVSFENHFWYGTKKRVDTILVEHFGKYWFTDEAEAEAKLRELKEKDNEQR